MQINWKPCVLALTIQLLAIPSFGADSPDDVFWNSVRNADDVVELRAYLDAFPTGKYVESAKQRIELLTVRSGIEEEKRRQSAETIKKAEEDRFRVKVEEYDWKALVSGATSSETVRRFLRRYPASRHAESAQNKLDELTKAEAANAAEVERIRPGWVFKDCDVCPEMVVLPKGQFMMGSPNSEVGRDDDEGPQREVKIDYVLAVGKYEVTFDEWGACSNDKVRSCDWYDPPDHGWGRGRQPVIEVGWDRAQKYVQWLSRKTGKEYRLLSEAEWEYAARAGTTSPYPMGECAYTSDANFMVTFSPPQDSTAYSFNKPVPTQQKCPEKLERSPMRPVAVGSYPANAFGLYDMMGNVAEWIQDCWVKAYAGVPNDGSPHRPSGCLLDVRRGGAWNDSAGKIRSAARSYSVPLVTPYSFSVGFRVARKM